MPNKLTTATTYQTPAEAHLAKSLLESEGIQAFIADEHLISMNMWYSLAAGGVKLQVLEEELEIAQEILGASAEIKQAESTPGDWGSCPQCGSEKISFAEQKNRREKLLWGLLSLPIAMIPFFPAKKWFKCGSCQHRWKS